MFVVVHSTPFRGVSLCSRQLYDAHIDPQEWCVMSCCDPTYMYHDTSSIHKSDFMEYWHIHSLNCDAPFLNIDAPYDHAPKFCWANHWITDRKKPLWLTTRHMIGHRRNMTHKSILWRTVCIFDIPCVMSTDLDAPTTYASYNWQKLQIQMYIAEKNYIVVILRGNKFSNFEQRHHLPIYANYLINDATKFIFAPKRLKNPQSLLRQLHKTAAYD